MKRILEWIKAKAKLLNRRMKVVFVLFLTLCRKAGKAFVKWMKNQTEYIIVFAGLIFWFLFAAGGRWFGWATYPVGYFQKLCFGIVGMSVIVGVGWIWLGATFPQLKKLIDPDTMEINELTLWEKLKLSFWFFALYVGGAVFLASLY